MFKPAFALLALGLAISTAHARRGYVRARDGQVVEGHLRFESNHVVIVNAALDLWVRIALTNLDAVGFDAQPDQPLPSPSPDASAGPGTLPWPWQNDDIGSVVQAGGVDVSGRMFRVRSWGTNVLGNGDSFHFACKPVVGETEIIARLARVHCADPWATAGLMLRESLAADSRHVFLALTPARGGQLASRDRTGGETSIELLPGAMPAAWLKLRRDSDSITAWRSRDGQRWIQLGRVTGSWPEEVFMGLAVVGGRSGLVSEGFFEHVEEAASVRNRSYVPEVELVSGSMQTGYIAGLTETELRFDALGRAAISTPRVALIRFQPVPSKLARLLVPGRPGVLLTSGEFIEGDCRWIERARVTVNSIPLGVRRYDVNHDVIAVVLGRRALLAPRVYEIRTADGALWLANEVTLEPTGLLLREPQLGTRRLSWHEVVELRRAS